MLRHLRLRAIVALFASGSVALLSSAARAGQSCGSDSECAHGFACQVVAAGGCPAIACAPGETCAPCEPSVIKECVPGSCTLDSDCADGMVCHASETTSCSPATAPTCPSGQKCPPPTDAAPCTTETVHGCVPKYALPCDTAVSCGSGFECVQDPDSCACSGGGAAGSGTMTSSGAAGSAGNEVPASASTASGTSSECTCTPSTTKHCEPTAKTCSADGDCPATWTCAEPSVGRATCAGAARALPDGGVVTLPTTCDAGAPATPRPKECAPPTYGEYGRHGGKGTVGIPEGSGSQTSGSGADAGAPASNNGAASKGGGGCQVSPMERRTPGAFLLSALGLFGLASVARRRRSRLA